MVDIRPEAAEVWRTIVAKQEPAQRLANVIRASEDVRELALTELARRHAGDGLLALLERLTGEPMRPMVRSGPVRGR